MPLGMFARIFSLKITSPTDEVWARLHKHFSEPELVEIGYFIALTMGQQRWLRTLNIEHHQVLAGTDASMAPGFETDGCPEALQGAGRLLGEEAGAAADRRRSSSQPHPEVRRECGASRRARHFTASAILRDAAFGRSSG